MVQLVGQINMKYQLRIYSDIITYIEKESYNLRLHDFRVDGS